MALPESLARPIRQELANVDGRRIQIDRACARGEAGAHEVYARATLDSDGFVGGIERIQTRRCKSTAEVITTLRGVTASMEDNQQHIRSLVAVDTLDCIKEHFPTRRLPVSYSDEHIIDQAKGR